MRVRVLALVLAASGCSAPPLTPLSPSDASNVDAPAPPTSYQPVLAGTVPHAPVGLKPWRELNDRVAPGGGKSP